MCLVRLTEQEVHRSSKLWQREPKALFSDCGKVEGGTVKDLEVQIEITSGDGGVCIYCDQTTPYSGDWE